jgi:abhydrolase domain-containing protein 5
MYSQSSFKPNVFLKGFGSSSRPHFSTDANEAELQMVKFIEEWRKEVQLDQDFVLLGHR